MDCRYISVITLKVRVSSSSRQPISPKVNQFLEKDSRCFGVFDDVLATIKRKIFKLKYKHENGGSYVDALICNAPGIAVPHNRS
jgi:hypothetical protein